VKKAKILLYGIFVLLASGCSRCEDCQFQGGSETICETEFDNSQQYEDAIAERESSGASCSSTGGF
tara:strand:+ start:511 stop:708 length:198 start_codon:yes stop_codon:yes gene_type:complete